MNTTKQFRLAEWLNGIRDVSYIDRYYNWLVWVDGSDRLVVLFVLKEKFVVFRLSCTISSFI